MVACPQCAARFAAAEEIEKQWYERHIERSHGPQRVVRVSEPRTVSAA